MPPQHFLNFLPLPQGQDEFRPTGPVFLVATLTPTLVATLTMEFLSPDTRGEGSVKGATLITDSPRECFLKIPGEEQSIEISRLAIREISRRQEGLPL
jgi:hypothetical protein